MKNHTLTVYVMLFFFGTMLGGETNSVARKVIVFGDDLVADASGKIGLVESLRVQTGAQLVNAGRMGDTAQSALGRLDRDVLSQQPHIVVVLLGGNDARLHQWADQTRLDLSTIVAKIQSRGIKTVLVEIGGIGQPYEAIFPDIQRELKPTFVPDILAGMTNPFTGGALPDDAGYQEMATRITPAIIELSRALPQAPSLSVERAASKLVLGWQGERGVSYEVIKKNPNVRGWYPTGGFIVAAADGPIAFTLSIEEEHQLYAVRAIRH